MKYHQLTREQRYAIYLGLQEGKSLGAIARQLEVHKSTVSREVRRNGNRLGKYGWTAADERSRDRKGRLPGNRAVKDETMRVALRLLREEDWSPRQISGYLLLRGIRVSHERIAKDLKTAVYFADSYAAWQKGAIENTNKLVRQYIPKGTDFRELTDGYIHSVQLKLNRRPREKLNFSTPKDEFFKNLL